MAATLKTVTINDVTYPVIFSSNALARLEESLGLTTSQLGMVAASGRAGYRFMRAIFWAGLEGGRLRYLRNKVGEPRFKPFDLDEVGDLIDAAGGDAIVWAEEAEEIEGVKKPRHSHEVGRTVFEAWVSAFPARRELPPDLKPDPNPGQSPGTVS